MGIRFLCPHCQGKLHVKSFLAGKQGICPHCQQSLSIPETSDGALRQSGKIATQSATSTKSAHSANSSNTSPTPARQPDAAQNGNVPTGNVPTGNVPTGDVRNGDVPTGNVPTGNAEHHEVHGTSEMHGTSAEAEILWYVRAPDGGEYGPAEPLLMRQWVAEGRVGGSSLVWRTGWPHWQEAHAVFPELQTAINRVETPLHPAPAVKPQQPAAASASATVDAAPTTPRVSETPPVTTNTTPAATTGRQAESDPPYSVGAPIITPQKATPSKKPGPAGRADMRYRRRRGDRKGWWLMAVVLLALTSVALLITLVVVLMNQTS